MQILGVNSTSSTDVGRNLMTIKFMNRINMLLSVQSQAIQNKGEIAGIKQQQQDAIDTQKKNEDEYKKEQRHRILHAIVSIIAHVINLVMTIVRPVKHIAKAARKAVTKTVRKSIGKASQGLMQHIGLSQPMKRMAGGAKKALKTGVEKPGMGKRALTHIANGGAKRFIKRTAVIDGISGGLNGIGDGVFKVQTAKIKNAIDNLQNNIDLISTNYELSESLKQKEQDNIKKQVDANIQMLENVTSAVNSMGNLQMQVLTNAV
ncbi:hypothetical protein EL06_21275 [Salmonella enterica subsp. diarizonae]|uniref:Pathogenicity island 2 effector protein SseC n=1 Tax=Salmonella diarizonae TaxID=59204 RepID=A0A6C8Y0G6_SALDZ|nr:hypothetical protein [Salmonella enterica subsp. diarizonae]